jgi:tetratricopeptide (TPR) repeat protein
MRTTRLLLCLFSLLCFTACATQTIRVPVLVPAPVNLVNYELVAVDRFSGDGSEPFATELAGALGAAVNPVTGKPGFSVLSRQDVDRALDNARDRRGSEFDQRSMEVLERWRTAPIVLKGAVQQHACHDRVVEEQGKDAKGNPVVRQKQVFQATVEVLVEAADVAGNRTFDTVTLHGGASAEVWMDQRRATGPDPRALLATARSEVVRQYLERVLPRQTWVEVDLYKDGDFPDLQIGNGYAEVGNWNAAVAAYERALQGMTGEAADSRYMGLFNLGVAYEFSDRFAEARKTLEEAYALGKDSRILAELRRNEARQVEVQRLREQGGAAAAPAR